MAKRTKVAAEGEVPSIAASTQVAERQPASVSVDMGSLLTHLCSSTGLYSRETFLSLYSCITRLLRDYRMTGFVVTRLVENTATAAPSPSSEAETAAPSVQPLLETMAMALDKLPGMPLFRLPAHETRLFQDAHLDTSSRWGAQTSFLLILSDRLCAVLYWSAATHETFHLYEGGWTFHPGDCRTIASEIIPRLQALDCGPDLARLLNETSIDRRYDDKLNTLITALVQGLENRNRELSVALNQVKTLNKRNVDTERLAAIGQLSSVIAHEIRNPLGLIDLYAKLTEDQLAKLDFSALEAAQADKKDLVFKNLGLIRQAIGSLETILSELTSYSRPLQLTLAPASLTQLLTDLCDFYAPKYAEKGVTLQGPAPSASTEMLDVDADKLRQALLNLLKNALEASKSGTTVRVSLAHRKNDPQIYIKVSDEGSGIDAQHQKKLFTPYFSTKGNGTGLGLAHSRKILQAHGGSLELLHSEPGKGSIFALILPAASSSARGGAAS